MMNLLECKLSTCLSLAICYRLLSFVVKAENKTLVVWNMKSKKVAEGEMGGET